MVTVDDLVISLTIKETSKLGKLQKQLEDLQSGKLTTGIGGSGAGGLINNMFQKISSKLRSLIGNQVATHFQPHKMSLQAVAQREHYQRDRRGYAMKLIESGGEEKMKKEYKVTTTDELIELMQNKIENWFAYYDLIISKQMTTKGASSLLSSMNDFLFRGPLEGDKRKVYIEVIDSKFKEFQGEIETLFKGFGLDIIPQFTTFFMKSKFMEKLVRKGEGQGEWVSRTMIKDLLKLDETSEELFKKLQPAFNDATDLYDYISRASKILDMPLKAEMFDVEGKTIRSSNILKTLAADMFFLWETRLKGKGGAPRGFHDIFREILTKNFPYLAKHDIYEKRAVDITLLNANEEKLIELLGDEDISKYLSEGAFGFIELKKMLKAKHIAQVKEQEELYGKKPVIFGTSTSSNFETQNPGFKTLLIDIFTKLQKEGLMKKLTEQEIENEKKKSEAVLPVEQLINAVESISKMIEHQKDNPEFKEINENLANIIKKLDEEKIKIESSKILEE